jgi:hypothetical protein
MIFYLSFNKGNGPFSESTLVRNINQRILDEVSFKDAFLLFSNPPVLRARRLKEAETIVFIFHNNQINLIMLIILIILNFLELTCKGEIAYQVEAFQKSISLEN